MKKQILTEITELNTTDTYILVDVDGYKERHICNENLIEHNESILSGFNLHDIDGGIGILEDETPIISGDECRYFRKIETVEVTNQEVIMREVEAIAKRCIDETYGSKFKSLTNIEQQTICGEALKLALDEVMKNTQKEMNDYEFKEQLKESLKG